MLSFTGRGEKETTWAEMWLFIMPILLAFPIGLGFGKPDFWSLDLTLSPFIATRPITAGQLLAAKMKSAACSALARVGSCAGGRAHLHLSVLRYEALGAPVERIGNALFAGLPVVAANSWPRRRRC